MRKKEAYQLGIAAAVEANEYGDFTAGELADEDKFTEAMYECLMNQRQFEGHPTYDFEHQRNRDSLHEAFENGESEGVERARKERFPDEA